MNRYVKDKYATGRWREGKTSVSREQRLHRFIEAVGDCPVRDVTRAMLRTWRDERAKSLKPGSPSTEVKTIAALFNWAEAEGHVDRNPAKKLTHPSDEAARDAVAPFTWEQLCHVMGPRFRSHADKSRPSSDAHSRYWAGVLLMVTGALAAQYVAAVRDLLAAATRESVDAIMWSETAASIHQAALRGNARNTDNGLAGEATLWLPCWWPEIIKLVERALPGLRVEDWPVASQAARRATAKAKDGHRIVARREQRVLRVIDYLGGVAPDVDKVAIRDLRDGAGVSDLPRTTWSRVRHEALKRLGGTWAVGRDSRSLVREKEAA